MIRLFRMSFLITTVSLEHWIGENTVKSREKKKHVASRKGFSNLALDVLHLSLDMSTGEKEGGERDREGKR